MIGTNEMSSTSMDISESFRAEDLTKTDFFDFVTAPDMGIGIGINVGVGMVGLHTSHNNNNNNHHHNHHHHGSTITTTTTAQATVAATAGSTTVTRHDRTTSAVVSLTHDNNSDRDDATNNNNETVNNNNNNNNNNTPNNNTQNCNNNNNNNTTTNNHRNNNNNNNNNNSCNNNNNNNNGVDPTLQGYEFWHTDKEQSRLDSTIFEDLDRYCWQQQQQQQQQTVQQSSTTTTTSTSNHHPAHLDANSPNAQPQQHSNVVRSTNSSANTSASSNNGSISQPSSASSLDTNTDGQIYTLTVLNGSEPWLKREPDTQLANTLDLDSLLGNFPGYIKSEYPYDESGFTTDGTKDANMPVQVMPQNSISTNVLPPLITALTSPQHVATSNDVHLSQQLAQFQNNNNDWHMADHNAEQNSAESLLRSALQGKGYAKGLHIQNGLTLLPSSPSVKDDEMRRILFPTDADAIAFADSTLNSAQIFDDGHNGVQNGQHTSGINGDNGNSNSMLVDDMFLSLENVFNDDFEKIKRIANEVQQYCNAPPPPDYATTNDMLMQLTPSPTTTTTSSPTVLTIPVNSSTPQLPMQLQPPPSTNTINLQQQQQVVSTSSTPINRLTTTTSATTPTTTTTKNNKKYKRSSSANLINTNNNNNNNINNNNTSSINLNGSTLKTATSISSGGSNSSNSSNSPTHCNGQRKERSLHYCSICTKGFKDKYSVNVHIRTHTGEKPFSCSLCGKSFRQKAHLAKHYQTHMAQKNNGNMVKGNSGGGGGGSGVGAKHQRHQNNNNNNNNNSNRNLMVAQATVSSSTMGVINNVTTADVISVGGAPNEVSGAGATVTRTLLPPANGLLANR